MSMVLTLAPTMAPTLAPTPTMGWKFSHSPTRAPISYFIDDSDDDYVDVWNDNGLWTGMWLSTVIIFILLPIITSKRRRVLCMRGIRERRWIGDEEYEQYNSEGQRERRQLQRQQTQRHFQTTRTQEDEIRLQYLSFLMEDYSITLKDSDIHNGDENDKDDKETSVKSIRNEQSETEHDVENPCDATFDSSDGGSQDTMDTHRVDVNSTNSSLPVREKRVDSEDSQDLLEFDTNQKVSFPLSGQALTNQKEQAEDTSDSTTSRRLVSNGCAICLCPFEAGEEVVWSSNPDCCHVFHKDCIINWYLAVGRKAQRRRLRNNPNMTDEEALDHICKFPINCPCCRQPFCTETCSSDEKCEETDNSTSGDNNERTTALTISEA